MPAKALQNYVTCLSVSNSLRGKLVLSLESQIIFDESFRVTSVAYFNAEHNLLSCELVNCSLYCYSVLFYIDIILKQNKFPILSLFLVKNSK